MKTIKDLPEHSRPREKLQEKGASALTDEELVAAILGMGTAGRDVRAIARQVAALIREKQKNLPCRFAGRAGNGACQVVANPFRL